MIALIFISFFAILLVLGFSMVTAYGFAFLIPSFVSGGQLYGVTDIIEWLIDAAGSTTIYVAIALFVVSGNIMSEGELTEKIYDIFRYFLGNFKSCIPIVSVLTAIFYGMISGSGLAVTAAVATMVLPLLIDYEYDKLFFAAMLAAAGSLGQLIPPSSAILQYSAMAGTNEAQMFRVGAVIGFTCAGALLAITFWHTRKDGGNQEKIMESYNKLRERGFWDVFKTSIWGIMSPVIILGGIFTEVLEVVEAASVAVLYACFVSLFIYKSLDLEGLFNAFKGSIKNIASIALILAFAVAFSSLLDIFDGAAIIENSITSVLTTPNLFVLVSIIVMAVAMMFMNPIAIIVPIVAPIAESFGLDPMVYGAGMAAIMAIGQLTPPFGVSLYVVAGVTEVNPMTVAKKVFPIWLVMMILISIYMFLPQLASWAY